MDLSEAERVDLERQLTALQEREQDLTDFLENGPVAMHAVGANGEILWANCAELELLGYSREEYIGHSIAEFHVDTPVIKDILERLKRGETLSNCEARLRCKNGGIRHVQISSNVRWRDNRFLHTRCFTRDITAYKRYEQRLLTQNAVARVLANADSLESAAPAVLEVIGSHLACRTGLLWTVQEEEQVLRCTSDWDPASSGKRFAVLCQGLTFPRGSGLPGRVWSSTAPAWIEDLAADANFPRLQLAAEAGLRSGFAFPIVFSGCVHGVMEFFAEQAQPHTEDMLELAAYLGRQIGEFAERTLAQQHVREREQSYEVLTETASDGIITIDGRSTIIFANTAAAEMFGYTTAELVGADLNMLLPEHMRALQKRGLVRYLASAQRHASWRAMRLAGQHRAGFEIPVEVSFGEYERRGRHFFVAVIRDVSEREELDAALRQSAKLESLGVLAGGIAHDFNNLLTGILGNVSLALESAGPESPEREILEAAIEASERAANLTKQLLAYAGKGRFVVEPIDISTLVRDTSSLIHGAIPKHVMLRLDLQEPLAPVEADVAQIQQLIMNLVINAAEAIPEERSGTVLVITRTEDVDVQYLATLGATEIGPGMYVSIAVHDNGIGMDEATLAKIFDPFFTTKFTGRGLGLAAAGGIVRGHNGVLKVFSSPGQGTTFKVLLPVAAAGQARAVERTVAADLSGRGVVLVVDDEPIVRKIAAATLERYGYTVVTADDGLEGVERFRELQQDLELVILDMTMPVLGGEAAFERMRAMNPHIPVVLSSGYNEMEAVRRFAGKGLAGFLQKPYTAAALAERVQSILRGQGSSASL